MDRPEEVDPTSCDAQAGTLGGSVPGAGWPGASGRWEPVRTRRPMACSGV